MHDNPLCWPESPGFSAATSPHRASSQPQHCSSPGIAAARSTAADAAWGVQHAPAEHTATKETQTSTRFTAAALRAALCSQDAASGSSGVSFTFTDSHDATVNLNESGELMREASAALSPVLESSGANCTRPPAPGMHCDCRGAAPPRHFLSAAPTQLPPLAAHSTTCRVSLVGLTGNVGVAADPSVCPSESDTVFESCCEPSSLHSSLDITSGDCEPFRDRCWTTTMSIDCPGSDGVKADSSSAPGQSESFETCSGSGAVGYLACPPHDNTKFKAVPERDSLELEAEDTSVVFERMRAVVASRLSMISPRTATTVHPNEVTPDASSPAVVAPVQMRVLDKDLHSAACYVAEGTCDSFSVYSSPKGQDTNTSPVSMASQDSSFETGGRQGGHILPYEGQTFVRGHTHESEMSSDKVDMSHSTDAQHQESAGLLPPEGPVTVQRASAAQYSAPPRPPGVEDSLMIMMPSCSRTAMDSHGDGGVNEETERDPAANDDAEPDRPGTSLKPQQHMHVTPHACVDGTAPGHEGSSPHPVSAVEGASQVHQSHAQFPWDTEVSTDSRVVHIAATRVATYTAMCSILRPWCNLVAMTAYSWLQE